MSHRAGFNTTVATGKGGEKIPDFTLKHFEDSQIQMSNKNSFETMKLSSESQYKANKRTSAMDYSAATINAPFMRQAGVGLNKEGTSSTDDFKDPTHMKRPWDIAGELYEEHVKKHNDELARKREFEKTGVVKPNQWETTNASHYKWDRDLSTDTRFKPDFTNKYRQQLDQQDIIGDNIFHSNTRRLPGTLRTTSQQVHDDPSGKDGAVFNAKLAHANPNYVKKSMTTLGEWWTN